MARRVPLIKTATELRKAPRQARASETFDSIVEAAAHILGTEGAQALTTNRIAKRAGVSIGSLYQYFPNKRAIVRALVERELARAAGLRPSSLDDTALAPGTRMRAVVDWHFDVRIKDPALSRALRKLAEDVLPAEQRAELQALRSERTRRTVASALTPGSRDVDEVAFVVETCLDAIVDATLTRRTNWIGSESFRGEVARLLERYLAPG